MPLPFLIAGGLGLAAAGVKKGFDAKKKNEEAKRIVEEAEEKLKLPLKNFKLAQNDMEDYLSSFARFKLMVFQVQIQNFIDFIKKCKNSANSELNLEKVNFTDDDLKILESTVEKTYSISSSLTQGATSGALIAFGTYGTVGALATASTGTAIGTLSGAAATNATLAWFGGGSLAAGGGGIALGSAVIGGLAVAPLIAIIGFHQNSKAEKHLTAAYEYSSDVDIELEKITLQLEEFKAMKQYIDELGNTIVKICDRFDDLLDEINSSENACKHEKIQQLFVLGTGIKKHLEISLLDTNGQKNTHLKVEMERIAIS